VLGRRPDHRRTPIVLGRRPDHRRTPIVLGLSGNPMRRSCWPAVRITARTRCGDRAGRRPGTRRGDRAGPAVRRHHWCGGTVLATARARPFSSKR